MVAVLYKKLPRIWIHVQKGNLLRPITKAEGRKTGNSEAKEKNLLFFL